MPWGGKKAIRRHECHREARKPWGGKKAMGRHESQGAQQSWEEARKPWEAQKP